jgi:integrase/recombinase XerD
MNTEVSTKIILDKRKQRKKDGRFNVRLRVTYKREQRYYSTKYSLTQKEYDKVMDSDCRGKNKDLQLIFSAIENKARTHIDKLPEFSFEIFEKLFKSPKGNPTIKTHFESLIKKLKAEKRIGTADNYQTSLNSLLKFNQNKPLYFSRINENFLRRYENWMLESGNSLSTVGVYLRSLRAVFNIAIQDNIISKIYYPFGKRKYQIPSTKNTKKALKFEEVKQLYQHPTIEGSIEDRSKDYWFFSYLCNGINMKDIFRLKYRDIDFDRGEIRFIRSKTERSKRHDIQFIEVPITKEIKYIINKWGNNPVSQDTYVFPVLTDNITPKQEFERGKQAIKTTNKHLKRIGEELGFNLKFTTNTARHTYSTTLKRLGYSTEFIKEGLGHSDVKTTQLYLDSFEKEAKIKAANELLSFVYN